MSRNRNSFWSLSSGHMRRQKARSKAWKQAEERAAEEAGLNPQPVRWEYYAVDDYEDIINPPDFDHPNMYPRGMSYYFDTQAERDEFKFQHIAKIKAVWLEEKVARKAFREAEETRRKAEREAEAARMKAEAARRLAEEAERQARFRREAALYDAETAQLSCLPRKLRNLRDWLLGTHTWRGIRR